MRPVVDIKNPFVRRLILCTALPFCAVALANIAMAIAAYKYLLEVFEVFKITWKGN
jgi:sulfite reductase beta subunit-like hemoprotein